MSTPSDNKPCKGHIYKGHTYKVNSNTGYVEIDGLPITVTSADPHDWARQYIDKTEALMAAQVTQPSPAAVELALKALIDAYIDTRGCSRLVAAGFAAKAAKDEYQAISGRVSQ